MWNCPYALSQDNKTAKQSIVPHLEIAQVSREFGDVFAGEELEQVFSVANTGTAPLELAEQSPVKAATLSTRARYREVPVIRSLRPVPT